MRTLAALALVCFLCATSATVSLQVVRDEPDGVLSILAQRAAGGTPGESDWMRLFSSEGYVRLKARETSMGRSFDDGEFRAFVTGLEPAQRVAFASTLASWTSADPAAAAQRALAYLPPGSTLRAKVYPVIKPRHNSFVYDLNGDPAIFLYLDPAITRAQFVNTVAHELHHVGYAQNCPSADVKAAIVLLPAATQRTLQWIGAFGEGYAMLAAAGGPEIHPHVASPPSERARWDRDLAGFDRDLPAIDAFLVDVLDGRLTGDAATARGMSFFGEQGPWYTVGWKMAVTIERRLGRAELIRCICDPRRLLVTYDRVADSSAARWSPALVARVSEGVT
jgi:putative zinc-dependent peptidase DUF5700